MINLIALRALGAVALLAITLPVTAQARNFDDYADMPEPQRDQAIYQDGENQYMEDRMFEMQYQQEQMQREMQDRQEQMQQELNEQDIAPSEGEGYAPAR